MLNNDACVCVVILVSGLVSTIQQKGIAVELLYIDETFNYHTSTLMYGSQWGSLPAARSLH